MFSTNLDPPFETGLAPRRSRLSSHVDEMVSQIVTTFMLRTRNASWRKRPSEAQVPVIADDWWSADGDTCQASPA